MRKQRLLWQLYPTYLLLTVASLAVVAWYASASLRRFGEQAATADMQARAWLAESQFRPLLAAGETARIDAICKDLFQKTGTRLTVIRTDGTVVADSEVANPAEMENHVTRGDRPEVIDALAGRVRPALRFSDTLKQRMWYVAVPMREGGKPEGKIVGVVRTAISLAAVEHASAAVRLHVGLWSLVVAAVLTAATLVLSRRVTRPLEQLRQGAARFARGELAHRLSVADTLELGALAETMNQMAAELDDKMRAVVRQRNEREAILSSMIEGVVTVDAEQHVTALNRAAARLLEVDPARAVGRILAEVVRNPELHRLADAVLATRQPGESDMVLHGGADRILHVNGTVLYETPERQLGALLVFHDVTDLKKLETIRRDFVANVSHELRTPITSIKGFVETLLDGAMDDPRELERFLKIVAEQTDRLNAIFDDLLTLSRVEQGAEKAEFELAPAPIRGVLEAAIEACQLKAAEKGMRFVLACGADISAAVNPRLLEQAVINLIDNAIKYSPAQEVIDVGATRAGGEIVISVADHGCGISREHLPRIFERLYRVDPARSRKLGGTGLGLSIVKHIAQAHGGRATVESTVGRGSTFCIHLPLTRRRD